MNKHRALIYSLIVFTIAVVGFFCVEYYVSGRTTEERNALTGIPAVSTGFTGLIALALAMFTYLFFLRSEKLKIHAKGLIEANRRLEEEIIQRKAAEEKSANLAREWARTFDSIPDLISIHSNDFRIIRANQALADFFGLKKEEFIGKYCYEVFHGTKGPVADCPHQRTMETKKSVTVARSDWGTVCHSMVSTSPIFNKQWDVIGTVHIVKDTTEAKKLEERLRHAHHMGAVGQLAGGVAHEFNNILTAIINYGHLLKDTPSVNSEYINFIGKILALAEKATQISQNLLIYSKTQCLDLKPSDLNIIIKTAGPLVRNFKGKNIEFVQLLTDRPLMIMANENDIEQCIINLARNAADAMSAGGTLTIRSEVVEGDTSFIRSSRSGAQRPYALLSVTDTGTGIEDKTGRKIFEPFFTTKEVGEGTGLGLSIVYGIAKQHNGYIDVESGPENGPTFKLYFPLISKDTLLSKTKEASGNE